MKLFFAILLFVSTSALAEDNDKPWKSVIKGPNQPPGYNWHVGLFETESDCEKENAYQLSKPRRPDEAAFAKYLSGATAGCVYTGSRNKYILKLRNISNPAVLCVAKDKDFGDYRVILVGRPKETDNYRCD